jgi:hypothetical protein
LSPTPAAFWNAGQGTPRNSKRRDDADFSVEISPDADLEAQSERNGHRNIGYTAPNESLRRDCAD